MSIRSEWQAERDLDRDWPAPPADPVASGRQRLRFIPARLRDARQVIADYTVALRGCTDRVRASEANRKIADAQAEIVAIEAERAELADVIANAEAAAIAAEMEAV